MAELRRIKLLRKRGVPLEEIRQMLSGSRTVGDGMRRHLIVLERDRENLEQSIALCASLAECREHLADLDAESVLEQMERMERSGTTFQNKQRQDTRIRLVAPVVVTALTVLLMAGLAGLIVWGYTIDAEEAPPLPLVLLLAAIPLAVVGGVVLALVQRIREIGRGEEDDARKF